MTKGAFLCIEGGDGSGKGTQYNLLLEHLKADNVPVLPVDFPQYGQPSAELVELYLNNEFGTATELDPRLASALYAIDRLAAKDKIIAAQQEGKLVLANRFTASSMAYQGSKLSSSKERTDFFRWLHTFEHDTLGIPEPDYHIILHVPAAIAQQRVLQKADRGYTAKKLDGHEADLVYQQRAEQTYLDLTKTFPRQFCLLECVEGNHQKTPPEIHEELWGVLKGKGFV